MTTVHIGTPRPAERARLAAGVGAILRAARTTAGLNQSELARRAGVGNSVVSAYENGRSRPTVATLTRLALGLYPANREAALTLVRHLVAAAGSSLAGDQPGIPVAVTREMSVEVLLRSLAALGLDPDDERVRRVVIDQIRSVSAAASTTRASVPSELSAGTTVRAAIEAAVDIIDAEIIKDETVPQTQNGGRDAEAA